MKRFAIILAGLWTALICPASAGEPGEVVVEFLTALRSGEKAPGELLEQTMISPYCGEAKRLAIQERLERIGLLLRRGDYQLAEMEEKLDGEFAAVLVSAVSQLDPLDIEVFALGVGKVEAQWKIAPMPGTFDNCNLGFDEAVRQRADSLALWMSAERIRRLRDLRGEIERAFHDKMVEAVAAMNLKEAKPKEVVAALVRSSLDQNLPAVMALLGHLQEERSDEDRELLRVVSRGLKGLDRRNYWRLLTSPGVVRVLIEEDGGDDLDAEVAMLFSDPASSGTKLLRFILLRSDGRWEIELPSTLRLADAEDGRFQRAIWRDRDPDDAELQKKFSEYFEQNHEPLRSKTLDEAGQAITKVLREGSLEEFYRMLYRNEAMTAVDRRVAYAELGQFWSAFRKGTNSADGELVETVAHGKAGVLVYHVVSAAQLSQLTLMPLVVIEGDDGWAISPGVTRPGGFKEGAAGTKEDEEGAMKAYSDRKNELTEKAAAEFLKRFVEARPKAGAKVDPAAASELVKSFRNLLREGKLLESFGKCALLDPSDGAWEALESVTYEYRGARAGNMPDLELGVQNEGPWGAVSLRVASGPAADPDYLMYLMVETESGPRIVVDAGLRLAANKAREQMNKEVWTRIEEQVTADEAGLVRKLFQAHVERSKTDLEEWEKNTKSSP